MKLLLDENISWRLIKKLTHVFTDVIHVSALKITQPATDNSIWEFAKKNDYVIMSKDDDFEKTVLLRKAPPKLIFLKTYNLNTNKLAFLILDNSLKIRDFINSNDNDILEILGE